jgi:hypothetical protein
MNPSAVPNYERDTVLLEVSSFIMDIFLPRILHSHRHPIQAAPPGAVFAAWVFRFRRAYFPIPDLRLSSHPETVVPV